MKNIVIPFVDLKNRYQEEKKELLTCINKVLELGHLIMTPELSDFENNICHYTGSKHCIGLNSGTDALMMALMLAGVKKDDEVITTPISFIATAGAIAHIGARPVFVDTGSDLNMDVNLVESHITKKTKAIVPVHWAGKICDMDPLLKISDYFKIPVIEDSAQSMGSFYKKKHGGTFGLAGAVSCHPLKNLNGLGDGGLLLTDDDEIAKKTKRYRNHGLEGRDNCLEFGVNSRLDVLNAEVLNFRLKKLDKVVSKRQKNVNIYRQHIKTNKVVLPSENNFQKSSYVMCLALCEDRDKLKLFLEEQGIETLIYYGKPLHMHKAAKGLGYNKGDFPNAEEQCAKVLALPHHQYLDEKDIIFVSDKINEFYENSD